MGGRFGWAYVNCDDERHANIDGVTGSVMFLTGNNSISGSNHLLYKYANSVPGTGDTPVSSLILTGTLYVSGAISASSYHFEDITRIESSGSTRFGNTNDDQHIRTGSLHVGQRGGKTAFNVNLHASQSINVGGFRMNYRSLHGNSVGAIDYYSASMSDHILGVKGSGDKNGYSVVIYLPSATSSSPPVGAGAGSGGGTYSPMTGAVLTIKDEFTGSRAPVGAAPGAILVSASAALT